MELITGALVMYGFLWLLAGGIIGGIALYEYNISLFVIVYCCILFLIWSNKLFKPKTFLSKMFLCSVSTFMIMAIASYYNLDMNNFYIKLYVYSLQITFVVIASINFILFLRTVYILDKGEEYNMTDYIIYNFPLLHTDRYNALEFEEYLKKLKLFK